MLKVGNLKLKLLALALLFVTLVQSKELKLVKRHGVSSSSQDDHDHEHESEDSCSGSGVGDYSTKFQVISLFVIMFAGGLGAFMPIIGYHYKALKLPTSLIEVLKFFGIGVILSTAIIHIYPPANDYLNDPCIAGRLGNYEGWPGVIFMLAIFFMHVTEYIITSKLIHKNEAETGYAVKPISGDNENDPENFAIHTSHTHVHGASLGNGKLTKNTLSTYLLELCVSMHSITVGLTMGLTPKDETFVLCAAVAFHQLFEGFAIGDRLSRLNSDNSSLETVSTNLKTKKFPMFIGALVYMFATPLGQGIGMAVHSTFSSKSPSYLITLGVLEAISAGILVYVALVNLIAEEFSSLKFRSFSKSLQTYSFLAMYFGAAVMSLIGKWA
ncbi:Zinc transporter 5 [Smittium mucronatum]|uniref:Zinc transporter 5 n=1 Tax=Smittium mucronatum TaxID=133383 RepID=A0A1R0GQF4_9FUNG|nr:Zinc transporter 5 [Smittium mucronatum]